MHPALHTATRYVQPLREGGSLPAVVDTADGGLFVVKFRGAGQGVKALLAELIAGMLAHAAGLPVPELALVDVLPAFGRTEPDSEIQDILRGSRGLNVGMRYLDGAFNYDGGPAGEFVSSTLAARVVWFDAFVTNPDRTARNPNLLIWRRRPWLIDHGAALYGHHAWSAVDDARTVAPFTRIRDHVLLQSAGDLERADADMRSALGGRTIDSVIDAIPDPFLEDPTVATDFPTAAAARDRYRSFLHARLAASRNFVEDAIAARAEKRSEPPVRLTSRR